MSGAGRRSWPPSTHRRDGAASSAIGQADLPTGGLLSTVALGAMSLLPGDALLTWGWRIPFLLSFLLLGVGLCVRLRVSESPLFEALESSARPEVSGSLLRGVDATVPPVMASSLFGSFAVSYAVSLGHPCSTVLTALSCAWAGAVVMTPVYGLLSDRWGRRPVYVTGAAAPAVLAYPLFLAIGSGWTALLFVAFVVGFALIVVSMSAALAALLSELFPTAVRYTGVSAAYQLASIIAGFTPLVAGSLLALSGGGTNIGGVVVLVVAIGVAALIAVWTGGESRGSDLARLDPDAVVSGSGSAGTQPAAASVVRL